MDLVQLKRFLVSAELGSFGKAARQLNVTQPAFTQSIKSLEAALGEDVFIRGAKGVKLTAFGSMLVPRAQLIVNETGRIRDDIASLKSVKNARLIVGVAPYLGARIFPRALDAFIAKMPNVSLKVVEGQGGDFARLLLINEIDVAFCGYNEAFAHDQVLKFESLFKQKHKLFARSTHPIFKMKRTPTVNDLANCRWVVYDHEWIMQRMAFLFQGAGGNTQPEYIKTNSLSLMVGLTLHADAMALLPVDHIAGELERGELRSVSAPKFDVMSESGVLSRRDVSKTSAMKQLIAILANQAGHIGG